MISFVAMLRSSEGASMHYEVSTESELGRVPVICERRTGYRRNWYAERDVGSEPHPITAEAERRARSGSGRARFRRMLALSERIANEAMPEELRAEFLELEEALNAHWLEVASEHFNLGVEAGLHQAAIDPEALRRLPIRDRLRALIAALDDAIDEL
jgi:hypothetical protein